MPAADLVVYGGTVATEYGVFKATVVVRDGRVAALLDADDRGPDADEKIDASGKLVIPAGVDAHCHFDEPSTTETREGFETGTRSAAAGGVTTVLEHPISLPPPKDAETFAAKARHGQDPQRDGFRPVGRAHSGVDRAHPEQCTRWARWRSKAFMSEAGARLPDGRRRRIPAGHAARGPARRHHRGPRRRRGADELLHASARGAGRRDPRAIAKGRPPIAEFEAIQRAIMLAQHAGARLHIVHMSIPEGADLVEAARRRVCR